MISLKIKIKCDGVVTDSVAWHIHGLESRKMTWSLVQVSSVCFHAVMAAWEVGTDLRLPPAPRQTPPPALSGEKGGNGLHRGWSRNKISPRRAFVCFFLYVVLFFKTCEGITYQKDVVFKIFFILNHHPLVVTVRHHPLIPALCSAWFARNLQKSTPTPWPQEPMTLPKPGIYYFPWEVSAGQVPDGGTLRTFGRWDACFSTKWGGCLSGCLPLKKTMKIVIILSD